MMAALFLVFVIAIGLAFARLRFWALGVGVVALLFSLWMFLFHMTDTVAVRL